MVVKGLGGAVEQHAQFKLRVRQVRMVLSQDTFYKVVHHLIRHKTARVTGFSGIIQICPEMIN